MDTHILYIPSSITVEPFGLPLCQIQLLTTAVRDLHTNQLLLEPPPPPRARPEMMLVSA